MPSEAEAVGARFEWREVPWAVPEFDAYTLCTVEVDKKFRPLLVSH